MPAAISIGGPACAVEAPLPQYRWTPDYAIPA
jgi:hypothetical protein